MNDSVEGHRSPSASRGSTEQTPLLGGGLGHGPRGHPPNAGSDVEELSSSRLAVVFGSIWVDRISSSDFAYGLTNSSWVIVVLTALGEVTPSERPTIEIPPST